jgi:hypothetical protein
LGVGEAKSGGCGRDPEKPGKTGVGGDKTAKLLIMIEMIKAGKLS